MKKKGRTELFPANKMAKIEEMFFSGICTFFFHFFHFFSLFGKRVENSGKKGSEKENETTKFDNMIKLQIL